MAKEEQEHNYSFATIGAIAADVIKEGRA